MNKQFVHVRPPLNEDVLRSLCEICRRKGGKPDEAKLGPLLQRIVDRSWLLHRAIETDAYSRLVKAWNEQREAAEAVVAVRSDLHVALNGPGPRIDLLAEEALAERFVKERRKLGLVSAQLAEAVSQTLRDFCEIQFLGRDRLMAAVSMLDGELVISATTVPKSSRGRPRMKGHVECRYFVHGLLTAVYRAGGGKLGFNRTYGGLLRSAVELFMPYLPPRMTDDLSSRVLADVRQHWPRHTIDLEILLWLDGFLTDMIKAGKFAILQDKDS